RAHPQPAPPRGQEASAPARPPAEARGEAAEGSRAAAAWAHGRTHRTGSDLVAHAHKPDFGIERGCAAGSEVGLGVDLGTEVESGPDRGPAFESGTDLGPDLGPDVERHRRPDRGRRPGPERNDEGRPGT